MAVYTLYCCRPDGASTYFEPFELPSDAEAWTAAARLLDQHRSCDHVTAWQGERLVLTLDRKAAAGAARA
ncbi:MAG TPA: hypothetical protein VIE16_13125 [Phenylobacterium sp.]|jgi:hypothetical protein